MDANREAALKAVMHLANEAEMQLFHGNKNKNGPLLHILLMAKRESAEALLQLASVDPAETEAVRRLQSTVRRFPDLVHWVGALLAGGDEAYDELKEISAGEVEEVREIIRSQIEPGDDE